MGLIDLGRLFGGYDNRPLGSHSRAALEGPMRVEENMRKCVVLIGVSPAGSFIPIGTAFIVTVDEGGHRFDHIVTALHNLEMIQGNVAELRVNTRDNKSTIVQTQKDKWVCHPDHDPKRRYIDVAVLPVGWTGHPGTGMANTALAEDSFLSKELQSHLQIEPGEPVVTIGLLTSHYGEVHNLPVARVGNIALMRSGDDLVPTNHGYMDAHLVECRSIGGLSGSPVFVQIAPHRILDGKIVQSSGFKMAYLFGVMQGHYMTREPNDIASDTPDERDRASLDSLNTGIAVVVPIDKVVETIYQPFLLDWRKQSVRDQRARSGHTDDSAHVPRASNLSQAAEPSVENPDHLEDFTSLLSAAVKPPKATG